MFDIGFSELIVIGVVALLVIGPERLPRVARTAGVLFGRFQRYVSNVKNDIQREMDAADLGKLKTEVQDAARSLEQGFDQQVKAAETEMQTLERTLDPGESPPAGAAPAADPVQQPLDLGEPAPAQAPAPIHKPVG